MVYQQVNFMQKQQQKNIMIFIDNVLYMPFPDCSTVYINDFRKKVENIQ